MTTTERQQYQQRLDLAKRQLDGLAFEQGRFFERETRYRKKLTAIHQHQEQLTASQRDLRMEIERIEARLGKI